MYLNGEKDSKIKIKQVIFTDQEMTSKKVATPMKYIYEPSPKMFLVFKEVITN
jgi:hypothetical protein